MAVLRLYLNDVQHLRCYISSFFSLKLLASGKSLDNRLPGQLTSWANVDNGNINIDKTINNKTLFVLMRIALSPQIKQEMNINYKIDRN